MANENAGSQKPELALGSIITIGIVIAVGLFLLKFGQKNESGLVGQTAPDFTFSGANGKEERLSSLKGKTVLINFWASWCSPCMEEMPSLRKLEDRLASDPFVLLAVNLDGSDAAGEHFSDLKTMPQRLIYNYNKKEMGAYRINAVPVSILVDPKGIVKSVYSGAHDWADSRFVDFIRAAH